MSTPHRLLVLGFIAALSFMIPACTSKPPADPSGPTQAKPAAPKETLQQRFDRDNPGAQVLQIIETDLNKDGKQELAVAYRSPGSNGATVSLLLAEGQAVKVLDLDDAKSLHKLSVLDQGNVAHLLVLQLFGGRPYLATIWAFDGTTVRRLARTEADLSIEVSDNRLIAKRRKYHVTTEGFDVETATLFWDAQKGEYTVAR